MELNKIYTVYMLANHHHGTLYTGVTSRLAQRIWQHREGVFDGFTARHAVKRLVWTEEHGDVVQAIAREKRLKKWERAWKVALIERDNPNWDDLAITLFGFAMLPAAGHP